jgi:hypothetical protein
MSYCFLITVFNIKNINLPTPSPCKEQLKGPDVHPTYHLQVFIRKGKYNGQKPIKEVAINTTAITPDTIARTSEITFVKNRITRKEAIKIRIVLSVVPIFFFISLHYLIAC